jgi:hypothetical protein
VARIGVGNADRLFGTRRTAMAEQLGGRA